MRSGSGSTRGSSPRRSSSCSRARTPSAGGSAARRGRCPRRRSARGCRRGSSSSGSASASGLTKRSGPQVSSRRGTSPSSSLSIPPSLFPRGAVMRRPSRPYVQAWYGHWSVSRLPEPSHTSEPRCRQTFRNARSVSSLSRTSTTGTSPTHVAANEPGSGTSPSCPTYCHERRKMRSRSSCEHGRVRVPAPGQGLELDGAHGARGYRRHAAPRWRRVGSRPG